MKQSEARALIQSKITIDVNGCWLWPGDSPRYGTACIDGKFYGAHRLSWMAHRGRIGKMHVLHHCDVPKCVNPEHLFLGSHADNMDDFVTKDRSAVRELKHPKGKLTDGQVREIRTKHARGIPPSWLADDYGIATSYVRDIVTRRDKHGRGARHQADKSA